MQYLYTKVLYNAIIIKCASLDFIITVIQLHINYYLYQSLHIGRCVHQTSPVVNLLMILYHKYIQHINLSDKKVACTIEVLYTVHCIIYIYMQMTLDELLINLVHHI